MDITILREVVTVISFMVFMAIMAWAASGSNRQRFEEASRLPFEEGDEGGEGKRA
jgi:cytochrome c oxidase cbb3-type subunit 4